MANKSEYRTVSVRLPRDEFILFKNIANGKSHNSKLRELIKKELANPSGRFLSGKNKINYNKTNNSFSWLVELDNGKDIEVLKNLSDDFLKNLKDEIDNAIKQRNLWVHKNKDDSVDIPGELVEGEE